MDGPGVGVGWQVGGDGAGGRTFTFDMFTNGSCRMRLTSPLNPP